MTATTGSFLLVLGLLAAAALVFWALDEDGDDAGFELENQERAQPRDRPSKTDDQPAAPARKRKGAARDGVPRILPPDAAIEDVRDALSLEGKERERDVQAAYDSIARTVADDGAFARSLRNYLAVVHDPVVRGVVLAALGANRDEKNLTWLAGRLQKATTTTERMGAFLGLGYDADAARTECRTLGGLRHPGGALAGNRAVLTSVAGFLDAVTPQQAPDIVIPLLQAVKADVDVAALLVVDDKRTCKLYAGLKGANRKALRAYALRHEALPGAVRRVLEAAN